MSATLVIRIQDFQESLKNGNQAGSLRFIILSLMIVEYTCLAEMVGAIHFCFSWACMWSPQTLGADCRRHDSQENML